MPTIFEIFGLRFFFFSEDHNPIHVHVVKGDDDAKIEIEPEIKLIYQGIEKAGRKTGLTACRNVQGRNNRCME